ncbi:hypothetical protein PHYPO_G00145600 [Pangasianodon hypophthalmus]|uniref:Secreted protein n=1 Tax=Pangasianodon hypophthalmus TaxID=310915 RepID=A0A5N5K685_PANHP|nr:hypothetical protein PHYPO_G00145600 [Pangasianodon hypophthalmus]
MRKHQSPKTLLLGAIYTLFLFSQDQHEEETGLQFKAMAMIRVVSQKFSICAEMGISQILSGCWRPLVKELHLLVLRVPAFDTAPC